MKFIYSILLILLSSLTFAQKKQPGFLLLRGGVALKDDITKGMASASAGASFKNGFGLGFGASYFNFETPYFPITIDFSYYGTKKKISPFGLIQAGYGIHKYSTLYTKTSGGFTGSITGGLSLPISDGSKFILAAGLQHFGFSTTTRIPINDEKIKDKSNLNMFLITGGIKF